MTEPTAPNADVEKIQTALAQFSTVDAGLAALRTQYADVVFDVTTPKGMKDARAARAAIREPRFTVERVRKDAKAPLLALGRQLDAEAKRITEALTALEDPIDAQIRAEEERVERERQEKIAAEQKRVDGIRGRIAALERVPLERPRATAAQLREVFARLGAEGGDFAWAAEFADHARAVHAGALAELDRAIAAADEREAEAARLAAEREALERERAEQARRDAEARAQREAEERAAREAREAEERQIAEERAQLARERAELEAARAAAAPTPEPMAAPAAPAAPAAASVLPAATKPAEVPRPAPTLEVESLELVAHLRRQRAWSERTFGPATRVHGVVEHIRKELVEIEADPTDLLGWIDVAILAFDGAWRAGFTPEQIAGALVAKQSRNEARRWPDWRTAAPGQAIEHVRDGEAA